MSMHETMTILLYIHRSKVLIRDGMSMHNCIHNYSLDAPPPSPNTVQQEHPTTGSRSQAASDLFDGHDDPSARVPGLVTGAECSRAQQRPLHPMNALIVHLRPAAVAGSDAGAASGVLHAHHSHNQRQEKIKMSGVAQVADQVASHYAEPEIHHGICAGQKDKQTSR